MDEIELSPLGCQPIVIIGAPRSGTNMLRVVLTRLPGTATWPCDEINYIWRHGNAGWPTDELPADRATPRAQAYIRRTFVRLARARQVSFIIEKTCANSLRVEFVDRVLPEARYIFLVRNGLDATASACRRWCAGLEPTYLARKARFVPLTDLPVYAAQFARNRVQQLLSSERRQASWGPRFAGMDVMVRSHTLAEVCGEQWRQCATQASKALGQVAARRVAVVRYEDFVREPQVELARLLQFLEIPYDAALLEQATSGVAATNISKERAQLPPEFVARFTPTVHDALERIAKLERTLPSPIERQRCA